MGASWMPGFHNQTNRQTTDRMAQATFRDHHCSGPSCRKMPPGCRRGVVGRTHMPPPRRQPLAVPWQDLHICDPQALIPAASVCACSVRVIAHQLRINLSEGRVAQIMGRGPYRVWFKGIDYPGGHQRAHGINACSSAAAAWTLTTASQPDSSTIWIPHCTHQLGVERCM
jgi:hypothetical protein